MILQLNKLGLLSHNHHHHHRRHMSEATALASLHAFRSQVSDNLNRISESLKLGSESLSLTWIHNCFEMIPMIHNAFAKLMVAIDYPGSRWESCSVDEYLDYTINLLELLNSISLSLSNVNQDRVLLTHDLSVMESSPVLAIERMREIKKHDSMKEFKVIGGDTERTETGIGTGTDTDTGNGNEWIFHEAMLILKSIGFWVCGVVLSGLTGDIGPINAIMTRVVFGDSSLMALDSIFRKKFIEKGGLVKEIEEVNESVCLIVSSGIGDSDGGMELKRRLEVFGNGLKGLKEAEEGIFASVMAARNEVLEKLRRNI